MITVYHCPRCSAELESSGVLTIGPIEMPVFQCETCLVSRELFGPGSGEIEMAFTFAVNSLGQPVSPGDETPLGW